MASEICGKDPDRKNTFVLSKWSDRKMIVCSHSRSYILGGTRLFIRYKYCFDLHSQEVKLNIEYVKNAQGHCALKQWPSFSFQFWIKVNRKVPRPFIIWVLSVAFTVLPRGNHRKSNRSQKLVPTGSVNRNFYRTFLGDISLRPYHTVVLRPSIRHIIKTLRR